MDDVKRTTPDILKTARELLAKATEAPWYKEFKSVPLLGNENGNVPALMCSKNGRPRQVDSLLVAWRSYHFNEYDVDFIAFCRNHLPAILDLVERQQKFIELIAPALGDRLLAKGPLSREYAHSLIGEAKAILEGK